MATQAWAALAGEALNMEEVTSRSLRRQDRKGTAMTRASSVTQARPPDAQAFSESDDGKSDGPLITSFRTWANVQERLTFVSYMARLILSVTSSTASGSRTTSARSTSGVKTRVCPAAVV